MDYSVVTICLNSIGTLENTVRSVLNQSVLPRQYVFVDGGSNDGTLELISKMEVELTQNGVLVSVIDQQIADPNIAGIPHAWNLGISAVTSDLIFILNSDDWYGDVDLASKVLGEFQNDDTDAVVGQTFMRHSSDPAGSGDEVANKSLLFFPILNPLNHPAFFVRLSTYDRLGDYDSRYFISADYDFMYRVHIGGKIKMCTNICVDRLPGGLASKHLSVARHETYLIGKTRSNGFIWPLLALAIRTILRR